jgi:hypothetical protein
MSEQKADDPAGRECVVVLKSGAAFVARFPMVTVPLPGTPGDCLYAASVGQGAGPSWKHSDMAVMVPREDWLGFAPPGTPAEPAPPRPDAAGLLDIAGQLEGERPGGRMWWCEKISSRFIRLQERDTRTGNATRAWEITVEEVKP